VVALMGTIIAIGASASATVTVPTVVGQNTCDGFVVSASGDNLAGYWLEWNYGDAAGGDYALADLPQTFPHGEELDFGLYNGEELIDQLIDLDGTYTAPAECSTPELKPIEAKALDDHGCDSSELGIVITQIESEALAPPFVWVYRDGVPKEKVELTAFTGKTAHYVTTNHLDKVVTRITAEIYVDWDGQFNLPHGPCDTPPPTTTTTTVADTTTTTVAPPSTEGTTPPATNAPTPDGGRNESGGSPLAPYGIATGLLLTLLAGAKLINSRKGRHSEG